MRCASLVVFRQQLPHQILQRKKANESKTVCVCVPEQREWEFVCHSALSPPPLCRSAIIKSNFPRSGLKDKSIHLCLSSCKDSVVNKRCSSPRNSTLQAKSLLPLSLLSSWNASPSPPIPFILLLSEQRASWGQQDIFWKCIVLREQDTHIRFTSYTHIRTNQTQLQQPVIQQSAVIISISYSTSSGMCDIAVEMWQFNSKECQS